MSTDSVTKLVRGQDLALSELEESKSKKVDCNGYPILLVRKGEKVSALSDICTHLGAPLSEGDVEGDCIRCPWHGSLFSLETGQVIGSPAVRPQVQLEVRLVNG